MTLGHHNWQSFLNLLVLVGRVAQISCRYWYTTVGDVNARPLGPLLTKLITLLRYTIWQTTYYVSHQDGNDESVGI